jgi:hypothetical protein
MPVTDAERESARGGQDVGAVAGAGQAFRPRAAAAKEGPPTSTCAVLQALSHWVRSAIGEALPNKATEWR